MYWTEIYFRGRRYNHLTSNISEALNSWLIAPREMPILPMLEEIRHNRKVCEAANIDGWNSSFESRE
jgi:hypothetical protein